MPDDELAVTARRCRSQLLSGRPATSAVDAVRRLLAVQAQDPRGARLAIRARSAGLTATAVDHALSSERSLVISWLNRGTLHLVCAEDYWWLRALTTPRLAAGNARRLAQEGVSPADADRAVAVIETALAAGPLTRAELREHVARAGVRTQGQALVHILVLASLRGLIVRGPVAGAGYEQAFVLVRDWLGAPPPAVARDTALAELASRYLAGHAPAADRDLAVWAGISLGDARRGLAAAGPAAASGARVPELPPPRLLGAFDPLLHGWASREPILGAHQGVVTTNGLFRPFALASGRAVATWTMPAGRVVLAPLGPLDPAIQRALDDDAADVRRFLAGSATGQRTPG